MGNDTPMTTGSLCLDRSFSPLALDLLGTPIAPALVSYLFTSPWSPQTPQRAFRTQGTPCSRWSADNLDGCETGFSFDA